MRTSAAVALAIATCVTLVGNPTRLSAEDWCRESCDAWYVQCPSACVDAPDPAQCRRNCDKAHRDCLETCD